MSRNATEPSRSSLAEPPNSWEPRLAQSDCSSVRPGRVRWACQPFCAHAMRGPSAAADPTAARSNKSPGPRQGAVRANFSLSTHHVFSALVVLLLVLVLQFLAPRLPHELLRLTPPKDARDPILSAFSPREHPLPLHREPPVCPRPSQPPASLGTFNKRINRDTARSMALAEQAKRVADEFSWGPDAVNKAVKEFIREMGTSRTCTAPTRSASRRAGADSTQMRGCCRRVQS